jgi:hypothetical protein
MKIEGREDKSLRKLTFEQILKNFKLDKISANFLIRVDMGWQSGIIFTNQLFLKQDIKASKRRMKRQGNDDEYKIKLISK